jgi:hypothetical protein
LPVLLEPADVLLAPDAPLLPDPPVALLSALDSELWSELSWEEIDADADAACEPMLLVTEPTEDVEEATEEATEPADEVAEETAEENEDATELTNGE